MKYIVLILLHSVLRFIEDAYRFNDYVANISFSNKSVSFILLVGNAFRKYNDSYLVLFTNVLCISAACHEGDSPV